MSTFENGRGLLNYLPSCSPQAEYWRGVSEEGRSFVRKCLTVDPTNRPTVQELLDDPWLRNVAEHFVLDPQSESGAAMDLLPQVKKAFDARKTCGWGRGGCVSPLGSFLIADFGGFG